MKTVKEKLEKISLEISVLKNLSVMLDEHFHVERFDNVLMDHFSLTRLLNEYGSLNYVITNKLDDLDNELDEILKYLYTTERN